MKIWILEGRTDLPDDDNPWIPWYDATETMIIRAVNEQSARILASENGADENRTHRYNKKVPHETSPWLDPDYSTCVILSSDGEQGLILKDYFGS